MWKARSYKAAAGMLATCVTLSASACQNKWQGENIGAANATEGADDRAVANDVRRETVDEKGVVTAGNTEVTIASVCRDGDYRLFVSTAGKEQPWLKNPPAVAETDLFAEGLRRGDTGRGNERRWHRVAGSRRTWSVPNPGSHTQHWVALHAQGELHLQVWLPGDDHAGAGRAIGISRRTMARIWLNLAECMEQKDKTRRLGPQ